MEDTRIDPTRPVPRSTPESAQDLRRIGDYRILRLLGEGGMGAVYLGYDEGQDRQVAIKVLSDDMMSNQTHIDRFYREAKSGALLNHPNIVRFFSSGQDLATGKYYIVLEYVDGPSVRQLLEQRGRLPIGDAVHIVLDIARALEHVHSRNVVHRDIKPDNILTTRSGLAKLADLGLAKRTDEASHLTGARQSFGTSHYMPYEQALNARKADNRSDLYALGATFYHLVTGVVPFSGENHLEVVEKKSRGDFSPASILNEQVAPVLDDILGKLMAREPRNRYQTASELIVDLERAQLAAKIPSFADAESAKSDPWVQARLASATEPTRLDLDTPLPLAPAATRTGHWVIHFQNKAGQPCQARATTAQIVKRLREGRMPKGAEICREGDSVFQPPSRLAEFQAYLPKRRSRASRRASGADENNPFVLYSLKVVTIGIVVGLILMALVVLILFG